MSLSCGIAAETWLRIPRKITGEDHTIIMVMTSLPLERVFQCLFTVALVSASCWLSEIWQLSGRGTTGKLEVEFKINSRDVVASSSSISRPAARVPGELARRLIRKGLEKYVDRIPRTTSVSVLQKALFWEQPTSSERFCQSSKLLAPWGPWFGLCASETKQEGQRLQ